MDLHNNHNVYILGAGFSRDAGLPLVSDFLTRMRDSHPWLEQERRTDEADSVRRVLEFRLTAATATYWTQLDLENIEELFSLAASMAGDLETHIQRAIAATLDYCAAMAVRQRHHIQIEGAAWLKQASWAPASERGETIHAIQPYSYRVAKLLGMFANGQPVGENTFITFNYDTELEDALFNLGVPFGYGFRKKSADLDQSARTSAENPQIQVLKLHGSTNWGRRKKRGRTFTVFGNYKDLRKADAIPELVPPTWRKRFDDQLTYVWESAVQALSTATRVVVIGFSIPPADAHFKYLLAAGLRNNLSLRTIQFFNPDRDRLERRVRELLRLQYIDSQMISIHNVELKTLIGSTHWLPLLNRPHGPEQNYGEG